MVLLVLFSVLFEGSTYSFLQNVLSVLTLGVVLLVSYVCFVEWAYLKSRVFKFYLFFGSFVIGLLSVVSLQILFYIDHGDGFGFNAQDSLKYFDNARAIASNIRSGQDWLSNIYPYIKLEDSGFPMLGGALFFIFQESIYVLILLNIFLKGMSSIYVYKIGILVLGELESRFASILFMLIPASYYYVGVFLKETFMVYLLLFCVFHIMLIFGNKAGKLPQNRSKSIGVSASKIIVTMILMLMIRPANTMLLVVVIFFNYIFQKRSLNIQSVLLAIMLLLSIAFLVNSPLTQDSLDLIDKSSTQFENSIEFQANREGGNTLATNASVALLYPLSFVGPLPTIIQTQGQEHYWIHMAGNYYLATMSIFLLFALWRAFRQRDNSLLFLLVTGYLLMMTIAGHSTSVRRYLPIVPFVIIMIPYGIAYLKKNIVLIYFIYSIFVAFLIFSWNYFKLVGRG